MPLLGIALVIQIIVGGLLLNISPNSSSAETIRRSFKQVLGVSLVAQDTAPTDQPTDTPTPADQPTDTPATNQLPTDTPTPSAPSDTSSLSPTIDASLSPTQSPGIEQINPSPTDTSTSSGENVSNPNNAIQPSDTSASDTSQSQTDSTIMNPADVTTKTDDINQTSLDTSKRQDEAVLAATTPQDKTSILISSTQNNIQEVTNNLSSHDFTTTAFLTQRIEDHLQEVQHIAQSAPQDVQSQLRRETRKFCDSADPLLKTQQLQVPEDIEQDVEIARGTCLNIQQQ